MYEKVYGLDNPKEDNLVNLEDNFECDDLNNLKSLIVINNL